jgi:hypothetical protein
MDAANLQTILIAVLHKLAPGQTVGLTVEDFQAVQHAHNGKAHLFVKGNNEKKTLEVSLITPEKAQQIEHFKQLQSQMVSHGN